MQVGLQGRPSRMVWKFQRITVHEERHCLPGCQFFAAYRALAGSWRDSHSLQGTHEDLSASKCSGTGCKGKMSAKDTSWPPSQVTLPWCGFMYAPRHSFMHQHHKALSELVTRLDLDTQGRPQGLRVLQGVRTPPQCPDGQALRRRHPG